MPQNYDDKMNVDRVSVEERDEIKAYCDAHDISVSDFTRELVFQKIRENM